MWSKTFFQKKTRPHTQTKYKKSACGKPETPQVELGDTNTHENVFQFHFDEHCQRQQSGSKSIVTAAEENTYNILYNTLLVFKRVLYIDCIVLQTIPDIPKVHKILTSIGHSFCHQVGLDVSSGHNSAAILNVLAFHVYLMFFKKTININKYLPR